MLLTATGVVKLSDMGLARRLSTASDSFSTEKGGAGSIGWQAPEQMAWAAHRAETKAHGENASPEVNHVLEEMKAAAERLGLSAPDGAPKRLTRQVDLFALGCLIFYVLSNGGHPFGVPVKIFSQIFL